MGRHNLAAHSLRHLRFARRITVGQPLLTRAADSHTLPPYIVLDGRVLPLGRVLRHLPQSAATWPEQTALGKILPSDVSDLSDTSDAISASDAGLPPAETLLRLLPRLPAQPSANDDTSEFAGSWSTQQPTMFADESRLTPQDAPPVAGDRPVLPTKSPDHAPARPAAPRPRAQIVELPGIVSLPAEQSAEEEASSSDTRADEQHPTKASEPAALSEDVATVAAQAEEPELPLSLPAAPLSASDVTPARAPGEGITESIAEHVTPAPAPRSRSGKRASATPSRLSDALFPPTDADRSPQSWLTRLRQADQPTPPTPPTAPTPTTASANQRTGQRKASKGSHSARPPVPLTPQEPATPPDAPAPPATTPVDAEQPAVLPDSSRTLLHTLTGVDPASVHIYRGPVAERVTASQNADALTDGTTIALGTGHATDTPATLGLLAHELTHVAQRRTARFVPPVTRMASGQQRGQATSQAQQTAATPAGEESQAAWVEAHVTSLAGAPTAAQGMAPPAVFGQSESSARPPYEQPALVQQLRPDERPIWGNLPAPWEPLPDWMTPSVSSPSSGSQRMPRPAQPQPHQQTPTAQPASSAPSPASSSGTPGTQRAEHGRSLPTVDTGTAHAAQSYEGSAPEPDLDALAQQVHAILKRRLAAERRRFG